MLLQSCCYIGFKEFAICECYKSIVVTIEQHWYFGSTFLY